MKLKKLHLTNFRSFEGDHVFEFKDRFTVIAGVNGKGKTAILDALSIMLSRLLPPILGIAGGYRSLLLGDINKKTESVRIELSANCADNPVKMCLSRAIDDRRAHASRLPYAAKKIFREIYGDVSNRDDSAIPIAVYYTTDRAGFRLPNRLPKAVPRGQLAAYYGALFNQRMDYRDLVARLVVSVQLESAERTDNPHFIGERAVEAMNRVLGVFLEGFGVLRVEDNPLRLIVEKNRMPLDVPQLSDGERSFLAIVTDLCRRLTLANQRPTDDPLHGKGVVLIDELELHLHPSWQRDIVEKLRSTFPGIQFIGTTHSPFVVQTLREGELILLDKMILGDYANRGLEEVVSKVMGIEDPNVNPRYLQMLDVAQEYFRLLEIAKSADRRTVAQLKDKLHHLTQPYADNPAYQAFLEMHRVSVFKEKDTHETS